MPRGVLLLLHARAHARASEYIHTHAVVLTTASLHPALAELVGGQSAVYTAAGIMAGVAANVVIGAFLCCVWIEERREVRAAVRRLPPCLHCCRADASSCCYTPTAVPLQLPDREKRR